MSLYFGLERTFGHHLNTYDGKRRLGGSPLEPQLLFRAYTGLYVAAVLYVFSMNIICAGKDRPF